MADEGKKYVSVLYIDPSRDAQKSITDGFVRHRLSFVHLQGAEEAMRSLEKIDPEIIVCEQELLDGSGLSLLRQIRRAKTCRAPFVLLSRTRNLLVENAYRDGVEAVFFKPINVDALVALMKNVRNELKNPWQRPQPRLRTKQTVTIRRDLSLFSGAKILNISRGGMFVEYPVVPSLKSSLVDFAINLSPELGEPIWGKGQIRWVRKGVMTGPDGFGVQFMELNADARERITRFVNSLRTENFNA